MADPTYQEIVDAFAGERPTYERLIAKVEARLRERLRDEGIYATVTSRVKEADSFAIKALVGGRYQDPLREIGDKAGVRVVVPYLRQIEQVEAVVRELFTVIDREQKLAALAYNEVGYLGVHLDSRLNDDDARQMGVEFAGLRFEIQIRTIAQGAWAEVAHEQLYKPPADVPAHLKRRIYRLVSLVELFDNEVEAFLVEAAQTPGYREAVALQPLAQLLLQRFGVSRRPDRQLSLVIAAAVVSLYDCGPAEVPSRIEAWIEENAQKLETVLAGCLAGSCAPILLQPESFLIFERLERDADRLLEAWPPEVPRAWLDEAAVAWGVRLPDTENQADESLAD